MGGRRGAGRGAQTRSEDVRLGRERERGVLARVLQRCRANGWGCVWVWVWVCLGVWVCVWVGVWVCLWVCGCVSGWVGRWREKEREVSRRLAQLEVGRCEICRVGLQAGDPGRPVQQFRSKG